MPGGGRCQWPATAIEKSPFKRGCVVARRPLLCWFWESKSPKATLHSEVGFGIKVRNSHTQFHSASNVNESKALKKLQKYPQITDITFSCLLFRFQSTSFTFFTCNRSFPFLLLIKKCGFEKNSYVFSYAKVVIRKQGFYRVWHKKKSRHWFTFFMSHL